jgi:hypothetical protein
MPNPYILLTVGTILTVIGLAILGHPLGIIVCATGCALLVGSGVSSYLEL